MKKVEGFLFEEGDHVLITHGHNKGMVGVVNYHDSLDDDVCYFIPELGDDEENYGWGADYSSPSKYLKYLTKAEAEKHNKTRPFLRVGTLDETIRIDGKFLKVGCQSISFADSNKIADFIKEHCKVATKSKVKKKPAPKKKTVKRK